MLWELIGINMEKLNQKLNVADETFNQEYHIIIFKKMVQYVAEVAYNKSVRQDTNDNEEMKTKLKVLHRLLDKYYSDTWNNIHEENLLVKEDRR